MARAAVSFCLISVSLLASGCVVVPLGDLLRPAPLQEQVIVQGDGFFSQDKIALIEVDGVITGEESFGLLSSQENTVAEVKARLNRARRDPEVRGVVLRVSSPGGEVTACDVIHNEIVEFKKAARVPVVAAIVDEGASGGYYIACAADSIHAHPTAIVGSIGVILQTFNIEGLFQKIGVETLAIKSAEKKDILSPFRARSPEERAILQKVIDDLYERFLEVASSRAGGLGREAVRLLADGRVFSGREALKLKLVDHVGYLREAIEEVEKRAGIERRPTVIRYGRGLQGGASLYSLAGEPPSAGRSPASSRSIFGAFSGGGIHLNFAAGSSPRSRFLYLWDPSFP